MLSIDEQIIGPLWTILARRKSQNGREWNDENNDSLMEEYSIVLIDKPPEFVKWLIVMVTRRFHWRPEPCDVQDMYLEYLGLSPNTQDTMAKLMEIRDRVGPYGLPGKGGIFVLGEPPEITSSPVLNAIVSRMGGWVRVCEEENPITFRITFEKAHKSIVELAKVNTRFLETSPVVQLEGSE